MYKFDVYVPQDNTNQEPPIHPFVYVAVGSIVAVVAKEASATTLYLNNGLMLHVGNDLATVATKIEYVEGNPPDASVPTPTP